MKNKFTLSSDAFGDNTHIPREYTGDGKNISPELSWQYAPANTKSFVLICDDPDAPHGAWTHWLIFNIPYTVNHLPTDADIPKLSGIVGKNSWSQNKYNGPCPPSGVHHYIFKLYAIDTMLTIDENGTKQEAMKAMEGHLLEYTELIGLYERAAELTP